MRQTEMRRGSERRRPGTTHQDSRPRSSFEAAQQAARRHSPQLRLPEDLVRGAFYITVDDLPDDGLQLSASGRRHWTVDVEGRRVPLAQPPQVVY